MTLGELIRRLRELDDEYMPATHVEVTDGHHTDPIQAVEPDPENDNWILIHINPEATP